MQEKDLVYLSYASNACYPAVSDKPPPGVAVDTTAGTWSFEGRTYQINGHIRRCRWGSHYGPIGVYDKSIVENLHYLVRGWQEASAHPVSHAFSD